MPQWGQFLEYLGYITLTYIQMFSPKNTSFSIKNAFQFFFTLVLLYSMQLFSVDPTIFSKNLELIFLLKETLENRPQKLLISAHTFFHSPAQATAHSQELIFHIKKMSQVIVE